MCSVLCQILEREKKSAAQSSYVHKINNLMFFFKLINYFWLHWVFIAVHGLSLVVVSGGYSSLWCAASHCGGFSCCGARALGTRAQQLWLAGCRAQSQ